MRLSQIAAEIAALDARDAAALHSRLRNPRFMALLQGTAGRGRTSATDYSHEDLIRARLFVAAFDCGMTTDEIALMGDALEQPPAAGSVHAPSAKIDGGIFYPKGLLSIMRGTAAGEDWVIELRFTIRNGLREVHPIVSLRENLTSVADRDLIDRALGRDPLIGTLTIPASDLIRPLLEE